MQARRWTSTTVAAVVTMGFTIVGFASPASADSAWHHSVGRASADDACPSTSAGDLAKGWSAWAPSWARWANDGAGGWVCDRTGPVGSASPDPSGIGCVVYGGGQYANFNGNWYIPESSPTYTDPACTPSSQNGVLTNAGVYAPPGFSALTLCQQVQPDAVRVDGTDLAPNVYECLPLG